MIAKQNYRAIVNGAGVSNSARADGLGAHFHIVFHGTNSGITSLSALAGESATSLEFPSHNLCRVPNPPIDRSATYVCLILDVALWTKRLSYRSVDWPKPSSLASQLEMKGHEAQELLALQRFGGR